MTQDKNKSSDDKLDKIVAEAHRNRDKREQGYREKSLKMYPWICGRCAREFTPENVHELTVHALPARWSKTKRGHTDMPNTRGLMQLLPHYMGTCMCIG